MKKSIFLTLIFALFPLFLLAQTEYYINETFENGLPSTWTKGGTNTLTSTTYGWQVASSTTTFEGYAGTRGMKCFAYVAASNANYGKTNTIRTPSFTLTSDAQFSFRYYVKNEPSFKVYVTTDNGATRTELDTALDSKTWQRKAYSLTGYVNQSVALIFEITMGSSSGSYAYVDDVKLQTMPLCGTPEDIALMSIGQTSATISWSENYFNGLVAQPAGYIYQFYQSTTTGDVLVESDTNRVALNREMSFTNLQPSTGYKITLMGNCYDVKKGHSEASSVFSFSTLGTSISLPYSNDFNSETTNVPAGWVTSYSSPNLVERNTATTYCFGSTGSSYKLTSTQYEQAMLVTPQINHAANDMLISFKVRISTLANNKYMVGLIQDPADMQTFIPLGDVRSVDATGQWFDVTIYTNETPFATMPNVSVAIVIPNSTSTTNQVVYIDNFEIKQIPSCPDLSDLTVTYRDSITFTIDWTEVRPASLGYQVELHNLADSTYQYRRLTTKPAQLSLLETSTPYEIRLRAICAVGDTGEWTLPLSDRTECGVLKTTTFQESFESGALDPCWQTHITDNGTGASGTPHAWSVYKSTSYASDGQYSGYLQDSRQGTKALLISRKISFPQGRAYEFAFDFYRPSTTLTDVKYQNECLNVYLNTTPDLEGATQMFHISHYCNFPPVEKAAGKYHYYSRVPVTGDYYIIFEGCMEYCTSIYIDNVQVYEAPSCPKPIEIAPVDTTNTTFTFGWQKGYEETQWIVRTELQDIGKTEPVRTDTALVSAQQYTITGLTPGTEYVVSIDVAAYCGAGDTSEWVQTGLVFITDCEVRTKFPYFEGFNSETFPPACWITRQTQAGTGTGTDYGDATWARISTTAVSSTYYTVPAAAQSKYTREGTKAILVTPQFRIPATSPKTLKFNFYRSSITTAAKQKQGMNVWVNTTPDTVGGTKLLFVPQAYQVSGIGVGTETKVGLYEYQVDIPQTGDLYIIFESVSAYNTTAMYLDNVQIYNTPLCADMLDGISVDNLTATSASLSAVSTEFAEFQVAVSTDNGFDPDSVAESSIFTSTTDPNGVMRITLQNLTPSTTYYVRYRSKCNLPGNWMNTQVVFTTECLPAVVTATKIFFEDFERLPLATTIAGCYSQLSTGSTNRYYTAETDFAHDGKIFKAYEGSRYARIQYNCNTWFYRSVELRAGVNYEMQVFAMQDEEVGASSFITFGWSSQSNGTNINVFLNELVLPANNEWNAVRGYFNVPADGTYYIGVKARQTSAQDYLFIDSWRLMEVECIPPTQINVSAGVDTANIMLVSLANQWEVKIGSSDFNPDQSQGDIYSGLTTNPRIFLSGLLPSHTYYIYARSVSSECTSAWQQCQTFTTQCGQYSLPFIETFDENTAISCWRISTTSQNYGRSSTISRRGGKSYSMSNATLISPYINIASFDQAVLTGWIYTQQASEMAFVVGTMTSTNDLGTASDPVAELNIVNYGEWTEFTVYFTNLDAEHLNDHYLYITVPGNDVYYFDDIELTLIPTCAKPSTFEVSGVSDTKADFSWVAGGSETAWEVKIYRIQTIDGEVVETLEQTKNAFNTSVTINGLRPNTEYYATVSAVCTASDRSRPTYSSSFATQCQTLPIPYVDNFATIVATNAMPQCWEVGASTPYNTYNQWTAYRTSSSATGVGYLRYYLTSTNAKTMRRNSKARVLSPTFNLQSDITAELRVNATVYKTGSLTIYISNDGGLTFNNVLATIEPTTTATARDFTYDLRAYLNNDVRFAFEIEVVDTLVAQYAYINSFKIEKIESCSRPVGITIDAALDHYVRLAVNDTAQIVPHTSWQYVYGLEGFDYNDSVIHNTVAQGNINNMIELSALRSNSNYQIYLRTDCGDGYSGWAGPFAFSTACSEIAEVPFVESFEKDDYCIQFLKEGSTPSGTLEYPYLYAMKNVSTATDGNSLVGLMGCKEYPFYAVLPEFDQPLNQLVLSFDYARVLNTQTTNFSIGIIADLDNLSSYRKIADLEAIYGLTYHGEFDIRDLAPDATEGHLAICWGPLQGTDAQGTCMRIDNCRVYPAPRCRNASFVVDEVGDNSITLNIDYRGDSIQVAYGRAGAAAANCQTIVAESSRVVINSLTKATNYTIYVRTSCDGEWLDWSAPQLVCTACDNVNLGINDVWVEAFDAYGAQQFPFPPCFTRLTTYTERDVDYPILTNVDQMFGSHSLLLMGDNLLALPRFGMPANELIASFYYRGQGELEFGILSDISAPETFIPVATLSSEMFDVKRFERDFSDLNIEGDYLAFRCTNNHSGIYVDSLKVRMANPCFELRNLRVASFVDTAATLIWRNAPATVRVEYQLTSSRGATPGTTTGNTVTFTNLRPSTTYKFKATAYCEGNVATRSDSVSFTTLADATVAPYSTSFEDATDNAKWHIVNGGESNKFIIGIDPAAVRSGVKALYISDNGSAYNYKLEDAKTSTVYAYRTVHFEPGTYAIAYDYRCGGSSTTDYGKAFLAPTDVTLAAGVTPDGLRYNAIPDNFISLDDNTYLAGTASRDWSAKYTIVSFDKATNMNLVFRWANNATGGGLPALSIDNVEISRLDCSHITSVKNQWLHSDEADFNASLSGQLVDIEYRVYRNDTVVDIDNNYIQRDTVTGTQTVELKNLPVATDLVLYLRTLCTNANPSAWYRTRFTTTPCEAINVTDPNAPWVEDFESYEITASATASYSMQCATFANKGYQINPDNSVSSSPFQLHRPTYVAPNSTADNGTYGRETLSGEVMLQSYCSNDNTMSHFAHLVADRYYTVSIWAKHGLTSMPAEVKLNIFLKNKRGSTTTLLSEVVYNQDYHQHAACFRVSETAMYELQIQVNDPSTALAYHYTCLDDMMVQVADIEAPTSINVSSITSTSANVVWSGNATKYQFQVYRAGFENELDVDSIMTATSYALTGLRPATSFYTRVRAIEGNDTSSWISAYFTTPCDVMPLPYEEDFTGTHLNRLPNCWDNNTFSSLVASGDYTTSDMYNWTVNQENIKGNLNNYVRLTASALNGTAVLATPQIHLDASIVKLSFDYRNTSTDALEVQVSTNGGATVAQVLGTLSNTSLDYQRITYDLSAFNGTDVVVLFRTYATHTSAATTGLISIDNIRVARYAPEINTVDYVCAGYDYVGNGFMINAVDLTSADSFVFEEHRFGEVADTVVRLNLIVESIPEMLRYDTICRGEVYVVPPFDDSAEPIVAAGTYVHHMSSIHGCDSVIRLQLYVKDLYEVLNVNICEGDSFAFAGAYYKESIHLVDTVINSRGCDSVTVLNLNVLSRLNATRDMICEGESYAWLDTVLTTTGYYARNYTNSLGCDSIEEIYLTVLPSVVDTTIHICQGGVYMFGGDMLTAEDNYSKHFVNTLGCDSLVNLTLVIDKPIVGVIEDYVCQGSDFLEYGFVIEAAELTGDTIVERMISTPSGCDSIVRVVLTYIPTVYDTINVTIASGESYDFGGNTYSEKGTYTHTFRTSEYYCDSIVTLNLDVIVGVNDAYMLPLTIAPNPIRSGTSTYISHEWTVEERTNMQVYVYSSTGSLVKEFAAKEFPIRIDSLHESGIYYVRVLAGNGTWYVGKLVVK